MFGFFIGFLTPIIAWFFWFMIVSMPVSVGIRVVMVVKVIAMPMSVTWCTVIIVMTILDYRLMASLIIYNNKMATACKD